MQKFAFPILGLVIGLGGYASATTIHHTTGYSTTSASGVVDRDGRVLAGVGFTVSHSQRGEYVLTFEPHYFGVNCAALVVEGVYHAILSRVEPSCSGSVVSFRVHLYDANGGVTDRAFGFVGTAMQPSRVP
ncbi:MAG: hypothetical protein WBV40_11285 [Candidatus Cybelea sp.]|jgi:hypothetical protein